MFAAHDPRYTSTSTLWLVVATLTAATLVVACLG